MEAIKAAVHIAFINGMYQVASTHIGQNTFHCLDRILKIIQDLNFFAAPEKEQMEALRDCEEFPSKRPLGWVLLIPLLLCFRVMRDVISLMVWPFNKSCSAMMAAHYIKNKRRDLRYIKIEGARMRGHTLENFKNPWPLKLFIKMITYGPLNIFQFVVTRVLGTTMSTTTHPPKKSVSNNC